MIIFLGGAHGVGKSYLATRVLSQLEIEHLTASQLIREAKGYASWSEDRRAQDVDANQELLIAAVKRRAEATTHLVLDGHFVLRGADNQLLKLGSDVFAQLQVGAVILVEAPHDVVMERLGARSGTVPSLADIAALSLAEREHAEYVSSNLRVPFVCLQSPSGLAFADVVRALLRPPVDHPSS